MLIFFSLYEATKSTTHRHDDIVLGSATDLVVCIEHEGVKQSDVKQR